MGMSLLVILVCRLIEAVICKIFKRKLNKKSERFNVRRSILGVLYVAFIIAITMHGVSKAKDIKTNRYELSINKSVENLNNLKIVMVADLHLGYNIGCSQMEKMVNLINAEEPDIILIAGDIFDNEYVALDDPAHLSLILSSLKSKYGTYAVYGNHDIDERIIGGFTFNWKDTSKGSSDEMDNFLSESHIKLLCDQYELIDDSFYIYGRPDYERPGKAVKSRKAPSLITKNLDMTKPVIVIDHEPRELLELSQAGVDLDLCGHTHDGQFFPMNLTSRYLTWENSWGILKKGNMTNIVTSGVGLFGPNIRVGTQAEICSIEIHFE